MVGCPNICTPPVCSYAPHTFIHPPYVHIPPRGVHNPPGAPCSLCSCMVFGALHVVGGVFLLNMYWDTAPLFGGASPLITPTLHCWFSVHFYSQGYQILCGPSPSMEGFGGVPPFNGVVGGHISSSVVHMLIFFVVHYVSCVDHSSDYYSSSYSGIFWPVISVISVSGSFPDRVSSKPWCGSTTTLDAEELWRWSWLHFCVTAANSIFNASSGLCQLCYGFSTGRFLFQS